MSTQHFDELMQESSKRSVSRAQSRSAVARCGSTSAPEINFLRHESARLHIQFWPRILIWVRKDFHHQGVQGGAGNKFASITKSEISCLIFRVHGCLFCSFVARSRRWVNENWLSRVQKSFSSVSSLLLIAFVRHPARKMWTFRSIWIMHSVGAR